jgi:hypothetical protein
MTEPNYYLYRITIVFLTQNAQNSQKPAGGLFCVALRFP